MLQIYIGKYPLIKAVILIIIHEKRNNIGNNIKKLQKKGLFYYNIQPTEKKGLYRHIVK